MQYDYTNENDVPVKMTITYQELKLIERLLSKKENDWRYDSMRKDFAEALRQVTEALSNHFQYEQYKLESKETDNA